VTIAGEEQPPQRFLAGADAVALAEQVIEKLQKETDAYRELSSSWAYISGNRIFAVLDCP
jgi:hypothetical protein